MKYLRCSLLLPLLLSGLVWADWNEGEPYKWLQRPDLSTTGIDICVDNTGDLGQRTIGDDFECREPGPITGVHLWGSWKNDLKGQITNIRVQFYSDDPVGPGGSDPDNPYSKPDQLLWDRWFDASQITERLYFTLPQGDFEWWWDPRSGTLLPNGDTQVWQYNIKIEDEPFFQEGMPDMPVIYWLVVEVKIDQAIDNSSFGWKTRDRWDGQFMDKAVWMGFGWVDIEYPQGHSYWPDPVDMSFVLTGKEEPHDELDFGDAPDGPYQTLQANDGARHIIGGPWLGDATDAPDGEPDGQPRPLADGDDNDGNDDENGVQIPVLVVGVPNAITFEVSSPDGLGGTVSGWIDLNGNGMWGDISAEQVVAGSFADGVYSVAFTVPAGSIIGQTYARFRISRDPAAMNPFGLAQDGEVEDYLVRIVQEYPDGLDFGDAPEGGMAYPSLGVMGQFPTCMNVGPAGWIQHNNFGAFFGPGVDFEPDGNAGMCPGFPPYDQDECFADGDAGLIMPGVFTIVGGTVVPCGGSTLMPLGRTCQTAMWGANIDIHVTNNMPNQTPGFVNVLIDWDQNGVWGGASPCPLGPAPEHVLVDFLVPNGFVGPLSMLMPPSFTIGPNAGYVWARITITEHPVGPGWTGEGIFEDGETEDYLLKVDRAEELDFGDAPDQPYPTLLVNNGAHHVIVPGMFMGNFIDAEPDGQPTGLADGDDINPPAGPDDEDGVVFLANANPMHEGLPAQVQITVSMDGFIDAWIDFEKNGDWSHPLEQIFASQPVTAGVNVLSFNVPVGLGGGGISPVTFARFRYSSTGGLSYVGRAGDGEVEDYLVLVEGEIENLADLGDAPDSTNNIGMAMTAYPGVAANFPTVYLDATGSMPQGPIHWRARNIAFLGASVTLEVEADSGPDEDFVNNIDPAADTPDQDGGDDGVSGLPLHLPYCDYAAFDYVVTVASAGPASILYVNVWFDWNRDGDWDDVLSPVCREKRVPEWAVQNQVVTNLAPGLHTLRTPAFLCWHPIFEEAPEEIWMRITLSEQPWTPTAGTLGDGGSGPASGYGLGETEDYLFVPDTSCVRCADLDCDGFVDLADFAIFASRWLDYCL